MKKIFFRIFSSLVSLMILFKIFLILRREIYFTIFQEIFKERSEDYRKLIYPFLGYVILSLILISSVRIFKDLKKPKKYGLLNSFFAFLLLAPFVGFIIQYFIDLNLVGSVSYSYLGCFVLFAIFGLDFEFSDYDD